MNPEENKALVRRFYEEVWRRGNVDVAREIFADDYVRHDLRSTPAEPGGGGMAKIAKDFRAAFPDLSFETEMMIVEGDLVAARWTMTGTNTGPWGGQGPTGKSVRFSGINIFRIEDGMVVELWNHRDDLGLMQQLGRPIYAGAAPREDA